MGALASSWLLEADSLDRLVQAGQPAFSEIRRAPELDGEDGVQVYQFILPSLELLGIGRVKSSLEMFGAIRNAGAPGAMDRFLEVGTQGNPRATLELAGGSEIPLPTFGLNVSGALAISEHAASEKRSRAVGRVSIEVRGEFPSIAGFMVPEEVL